MASHDIANDHPVRTPLEIWERAHEHVREYDLAGFADMFAVDGVMEIPFAPPGLPSRLEGRAAIKAALQPAGEAARNAGRRIEGYSSIVVHECVDPQTVIVEFDLNGRVEATGEAYRLSYIQVVRVQDGEIVSFRDYMNPLAVAGAVRPST